MIALTRPLTTVAPILHVLGASLLLALSAQCAVTLPFSPVPLTLQTLAIMVMGITMGSRKTVYAILLYLLEGACGLPVFAQGTFGLAALLGLRSGYFLGFILQGALVGFVTERKVLSLPSAFLLMLTSSLIQLIVGSIGLFPYLGFSAALYAGLTPFVYGGFIKAAIATCYYQTIKTEIKSFSV